MVGVRLRRPDRGWDHLRPLAAEHLVEGTGELGVVVAHQESDRQLLLLQVHREVSCLLGDHAESGVAVTPATMTCLVLR
jgi:hypothetical protein